MSWRRVKTSQRAQTAKPVSMLDLSKYDVVVGVDEAGWGPIAGPLVMSGVALPKDLTCPAFIKDSKKLSEATRKEAEVWVYKHATSVNISISDSELFSTSGAAVARDTAFTTLFNQLDTLYDGLDWIAIVDGDYVPSNIPKEKYITIIRGDTLYRSISAASIVAKVYHDYFMEDLHKEYPMYGWDCNKGYATPEHREALKKHGVSPYHRHNVKTVRRLLKESDEKTNK